MEGRISTHGKKMGCRASGTLPNRVPTFAFKADVETPATRRTVVRVSYPGVQNTPLYEFDGPDHRSRAAMFADSLKVPCYSPLDLLERLHALEKTLTGTKLFPVNLSFCLGVLKG